MSYSTWHTYGYGFRFSDLKGYTSESIGRLLRLAPDFEKKIQEDFKANGITNPTVKDYEEYDCDYDMGVGHLLREVIMETEGISMTLCDDFDCNRYLLYEPSYPWSMPTGERNLTLEELQTILQHYVSALKPENLSEIDYDYQSVENCG